MSRKKHRQRTLRSRNHAGASEARNHEKAGKLVSDSFADHDRVPFRPPMPEQSEPSDVDRPDGVGSPTEGQGDRTKAWDVDSFANIMGENITWFQEHEKHLLFQHPNWVDHYVVVASRAASKILASAPERASALEAGLKSPELHELAKREGMPPGNLISIMLLGETWGRADSEPSMD